MRYLDQLGAAVERYAPAVVTDAFRTVVGTPAAPSPAAPAAPSAPAADPVVVPSQSDAARTSGPHRTAPLPQGEVEFTFTAIPVAPLDLAHPLAMNTEVNGNWDLAVSGMDAFWRAGAAGQDPHNYWAQQAVQTSDWTDNVRVASGEARQGIETMGTAAHTLGPSALPAQLRLGIGAATLGIQTLHNPHAGAALADQSTREVLGGMVSAATTVDPAAMEQFLTEANQAIQADMAPAFQIFLEAESRGQNGAEAVRQSGRWDPETSRQLAAGFALYRTAQGMEVHDQPSFEARARVIAEGNRRIAAVEQGRTGPVERLLAEHPEWRPMADALGPFMYAPVGDGPAAERMRYIPDGQRFSHPDHRTSGAQAAITAQSAWEIRQARAGAP